MIYVYIKYIFFLKRKWWLIAFFGNCWHLVWPQATRNKGKTGRVLATRESVWIQYLFHFPQVFSSTLRPNSTTKSPLSLSLPPPRTAKSQSQSQSKSAEATAIQPSLAYPGRRGDPACRFSLLISVFYVVSGFLDRCSSLVWLILIRPRSGTSKNLIQLFCCSLGFHLIS